MANLISVLTVLSFVMSNYLFVKEIINKRTNLKIQNKYMWLSTSKSLFALITITNRSSEPISIVNAELGSVSVYRAEHHCFTNEDDPLLNINTSCFPIKLDSQETGDILIEFYSENNWNKNSIYDLKLITSKKTVCESVALSHLLIENEEAMKLASANHK